MNGAFFFHSWSTIGRFAIYTLFTAGCMLFIPGSSAYAHSLKKDGVISAVLHVQPDDTPLSNQPTEYTLFLHDSSQRFSMAQCDCTVNVERDGKTILSQPLNLNAQNTISGTVTFPHEGAYEIIFRGKPVVQDAFQPFTLRYVERVKQNPEVDQQPSSTFTYSMAAIVVSLIVIAFCIKVRYNSL